MRARRPRHVKDGPPRRARPFTPPPPSPRERPTFCVCCRRTPMDLSKIKIGENPPYDVNAIIEIPQGGEPVKYELDKESGAIFVDRFLHTAMYYPGNYGF